MTKDNEGNDDSDNKANDGGQWWCDAMPLANCPLKSRVLPPVTGVVHPATSRPLHIAAPV